VEASVTENLKSWLSETNSSSERLMELLAAARWLNDMVIKQLQARMKFEECGDRAAARAAAGEALSRSRETVGALRKFEQEIPQNIQEDQRIIVVDADGFVLGLVVDHVHEVLNVPKNLVEAPPRITSSGGLELSGVAKLEEGARLIMLLDVATLMKDQALRDVQSGPRPGAEAKAVEKKIADDGPESGPESSPESSDVQLVTFLLGAEEYGVPISQIQEIDRLGKITKVPKAAAFIEGITNLRGEVIPVLDTRKRFDLEVKAPDDRTRIIIVDVGGVKTGLVVDSVREVMNLARKDIAPPPETIGSGIDQQFISGIGKVDAGKRMIVLLDVQRILCRQEQVELAEVKA
jgi:purine-binding chemotaxis protein CheW